MLDGRFEGGLAGGLRLGLEGKRANTYSVFSLVKFHSDPLMSRPILAKLGVYSQAKCSSLSGHEYGEEHRGECRNMSSPRVVFNAPMKSFCTVFSKFLGIFVCCLIQLTLFFHYW